MYLFGGCTLNNGSASARSCLHKLTIRRELANTKGLHWQELPAGGDRPAGRFAQGCWIQHGNLYVFGGIRPNPKGNSRSADIWTLTGNTLPLLTTLDDLWQYNMEKQRWTQLEPSGTLPAARARMGVAFNGIMTYVCGGATGFEDVDRKLNLADVWLFDDIMCSWTQVVPDKSQATWMSGRYSHACGLVGAACLCTVGGCVSMSDRISPIKGLCIKLLTDRASIVSPFIRPESTSCSWGGIGGSRIYSPGMVGWLRNCGWWTGPEVAHKWPCVCCTCGEVEVQRTKMHIPRIKVCKGCRMVRYCSVECQMEAWPLHKEHCKLSSS
ncbi:g7641 [Coccomyxa elongata]